MDESPGQLNCTGFRCRHTSNELPQISERHPNVHFLFIQSETLARLTVYYDGRCDPQRKKVQREFTLEPDYIDHLNGLLEEANFPILNEEYLTQVGTDLMDLIITYQAGGKKYTESEFESCPRSKYAVSEPDRYKMSRTCPDAVAREARACYDFC